MNGRTWTTFEDQQLREEYGKVSIHRLALKLNRTAKSLHQRASKLGLAFDRRAELGGKFKRFIRRKLREGWTDGQIAREWGANVGTVGAWRRRMKLASNRFGPAHLAKMYEHYKLNLRESGVKSLVQIRWMKRRIAVARAAKIGRAA